MYFKVMRDNHVVDVLDSITYIAYQKKHDILLLSDIQTAQAILSSDGKRGWHIEGLYNFEPDNTVYQIEQVKQSEYQKIKLEMGV